MEKKAPNTPDSEAGQEAPDTLKPNIAKILCLITLGINTVVAYRLFLRNVDPAPAKKAAPGHPEHEPLRIPIDPETGLPIKKGVPAPPQEFPKPKNERKPEKPPTRNRRPPGSVYAQM